MNAVIKPWLVAGLVVPLAGYVLLSAVLIVKLSRFDDFKRQAEEAEARTAERRTELSALQIEVESLIKRKDVLAPTVADWEKRLKEMHDAQATADSLNAKQRQTEADFAQASKRLEDINRTLLDADKQKTELTSTVDRLKSELATLTKTEIDAKEQASLAAEAERRLNDATSALANVDARRNQLETDASAAQTRFEQMQKEADDLRQAREKLNTELAALRQQIQAQEDQLATYDQKSAELKALQATAQQEEQKLAMAQQQLAIVEARVSEMEAKQAKGAAELAQLNDRLGQVRKEGADAEALLDTAKAALQRADADLAPTLRRFVETQASQDQLAHDQPKLIAQIAASTKQLEQARKDGADAEIRRDTAKAESQKADTDLAAARTQLQVFVVKQSELTRESSRLEATVEQLKTEKEALEKEIGRQEAQSEKAP